MKRSILLPLALAAAGCHEGARMEHTNASTTAELNAIAANTSETAGNMQAAEGTDTQAMGSAFRSGATAPVTARGTRLPH